MINELITNSLKYAWNDKIKNRHINLKVALKSANKIKINLSDNGIGFEDNKINKNSSSFGMSLISSIVEQYDGTIKLKSQKGAVVEIEMQIPDLQ